MTYQTACLAACSGKTAVAYAGPCLPGGTPEAAAMAANPDPAKLPADLAGRHPIASLFGPGIGPKGAGGTAGRQRVATARDMARYLREGYVLVGTIPTQQEEEGAAPVEAVPVKPASNKDAE